MRNEMIESGTPLATVDYLPHLNLLLDVLKQQDIFAFQPRALTIKAAEVATLVARRPFEPKKNGRLAPFPVPFAYSIGTKMATVNLEDEQALFTFGRRIEEIRALLLTQMQKTFDASALGVTSLQEYLVGLARPLQKFTAEKIEGLRYPFEKELGLSKRRMHLRSYNTRPAASEVRYRGHKLTISLENATSFPDDLIQALCTVMEEENLSEEEILEGRAVLKRSVADPTSEISRLQQLAEEEALGRMKMEASIRFLTHFCNEMAAFQQSQRAPLEEHREGLAELQRQLRMLGRFRAFLNDPGVQDSAYQIGYDRYLCNVRDLFSPAHCFNILPIWAEAEGALGETQDQAKDQQIYTFGERIKLNGRVGLIESDFLYYISLLDTSSSFHQERLTGAHWNNRSFAAEVLQIAILYYAMFNLPDDETFSPRMWDLVSRLNTYPADQKAGLLRRIHKQFKDSPANDHIEKARLAIEDFLKRASVGPAPFSFYCYLTIRGGILERDETRMTLEKRFFKKDLFVSSEESAKTALRYFEVRDAAAEGDALYALPFRLTFEPLYLTEIEEGSIEKATIQNDVERWRMLPVLFVPDVAVCQTQCEKIFRLYGRVQIAYRETPPPLPPQPSASEPAREQDTDPASPATALYRTTFLLLSYLCLDVLREQIVPQLLQNNRCLFYPLFRLHHQKQEKGREHIKVPNEEKAMQGFSKVLAHMLSQEPGLLASSQGLYYESLESAGKTNYALENALCSLYSVLPRLVRRPATAPRTLDRMAIIVISSRRCDTHARAARELLCVYGEIIGFQQQTDGSLLIEQIKTFSVNEWSESAYSTPRTLIDEVRHCYEAGYRHILYVAKAPYTSTVHFTRKEEGEELFFMSPEIIQGVMKAFPEVLLYPVYTDRYYVVRVNPNAQKESLYVDDARELRTLMSDPNKSSVVFWNIMNGIEVKAGQDQKRHTLYNGVVSYTTLINMYDDPLYDQAIRNNLLDGGQPGSQRAAILDFLSYFHGVRYERFHGGVQFKLDPYQGIIGFDSVGARAQVPSMDFRVRFNSLAFLTLVRGVLRRNPPRDPSPSRAEAPVTESEDVPAFPDITFSVERTPEKKEEQA